MVERVRWEDRQARVHVTEMWGALPHGEQVRFTRISYNLWRFAGGEGAVVLRDGAPVGWVEGEPEHANPGDVVVR